MFQITSIMSQNATVTAAEYPFFLHPIDIDSSSESLEESNSDIFRAMDCDLEGDRSSPSVLRANPISEVCDELRVISPNPYSNLEENAQCSPERRLTELSVDLGCDWAMEEEAMNETQAIENFSSSGSEKATSIYSFYFEALPREDDDCDEFSLSSHASDGFDEDDICFEGISADPASFWEKSDPLVTNERSLSPTQISLESELRGQRHRGVA